MACYIDPFSLHRIIQKLCPVTKSVTATARKTNATMIAPYTMVLISFLFFMLRMNPRTARKNNYPKYVITLDELVTGTDDSGIRIVHLKDFLLKENL